jgi:ABC-type multidrug transport system fused ATPase/permease subunit
VSFSLFAVISFFLHKYMHTRASQLGLLSSRLNISSNETILEALSAFRELTVRNRKNYYVNEVGHLRKELASSAAEMSFMPYVSKYVLETSIVAGAVLIGFVQFMFRDASTALGVIAIFLAAGSRIAPAVLRLQQGLISIRGGLGMAAPTLALLESLEKVPKGDTTVAPLLVSHEGFTSEVRIKNVSYTYPDQEIPAVKNLNLVIEPGTFVAIVGPSGSGKTTLTDLLLGVINPDLGEIEISGLQPKMAFSKWPGAVAYVPQDVMASSSTLRQNIALGFPIFEATDELVKWAASVAQLEELLSATELGLDHEVGENGSRLSGGQRQRLGVARALFTKPKLLVLDEATSALDGETETKLTNELSSLRGSTTVVVIAHRLSTIRNADLVIYFEKGEIIESGTFDEIRSKVSSFDYQAKSLGL